MRWAVGITFACAVGAFLPAPVMAQPLAALEISRETIQATGGAQPRTQVEPHIAVDPNNPQIVVGVVQEGRFPDGGAVALGYTTSHDGGQTWTADDLSQLTVATGGPFERGSDPAVAFGPDGAVYAASLLFGGSRSAIAVQRSDNGGLTFGAPVLAQDDADPSLFNDKDWIAVDTFPGSPQRGRVYVVWDQGNNSGQPVLLRFSDDRGKTWSPLVFVSNAAGTGIGALPVVQPDGTLTVVYEDFVAGTEIAQTSHDGGVSFGSPVTIGAIQGGAIPDIRSGGLPAAAVDPSTGNLYVVWEDSRFRTDGLRDIVSTRSADGGATWSAIERINPDATNSHLDHFTPAVAALDGHVHVTYRTRDTSTGLSLLVDMRYLLSQDGGITFSGERVLGDPTDLRFAAQTTTRDCGSPPCYFLGDYMGVAVSPQAVHPVWCRAFEDPAASPRNQSTWSSRIIGSCGDGVSEADEQCDGTDAAACPGACQSDCTCPCPNLVADPKATIAIKTKRDAGSLSVKEIVALGSYNGEPVSVRLDDGDSTPIVGRAVGALPAKGKTGKVWEYQVPEKGLRRVRLTSLGPRQPGMFRIVVTASKWFTASAANQSAAQTQLTVTVGGQCFAHPATKKTD
jgi:hypothetical protein